MRGEKALNLGVRPFSSKYDEQKYFITPLGHSRNCWWRTARGRWFTDHVSRYSDTAIRLLLYRPHAYVRAVWHLFGPEQSTGLGRACWVCFLVHGDPHGSHLCPQPLRF